MTTVTRGNSLVLVVLPVCLVVGIVIAAVFFIFIGFTKESANAKASSQPPMPRMEVVSEQPYPYPLSASVFVLRDRVTGREFVVFRSGNGVCMAEILPAPAGAGVPPTPVPPVPPEKEEQR